MPEQQSLGNAGRLGQLADRRAAEPLAGEQRHRRIDDSLAALVIIEPGDGHADQSKRSLTMGQETGCWPKKLGGLPPKAAQSAVWRRPLYPLFRPAAHHTQI